MTRRFLALLALLLLGLAAPAQADVFRPAYLEIVQQRGAPDRYAVTWKVPALDADRTLAITPVFPKGTRVLDAPVRRYAGGSTTMRWQAALRGGLEGRAVRFDSRVVANIDVLVRYRSADGVEQVRRVTAGDPVFRIAPRAGSWEVIRSYTLIGIEHILAGADHLLFVLALMLIVRDLRRLLATVTAFTIAHSITLGLATFEIVRVPGPPVEAVIALSIVFVACEILRMTRGERGLAAQRPWLVAFLFGLLHGLGFAGALAEVGLPQDAVPLALACFNLGVELGQLAFVALCLGLGLLARRLAFVEQRQASLRTAMTYAIGGIASFWVFERIAAF
jgi:hydrogenase/urease accessory protein HupE